MDWETPQDLFDKLDKEFHFDLDPCANDKNHKCSRYFKLEQDGLQQDWSGCTVFCNPPYGREIGKWVEKRIEQIERKLPDILEEIRKRFGGKSENKDD